LSYKLQMFDWIELTNPVAIWWIFLISISLINILLWSFTLKQRPNGSLWGPMGLQFFSALYVFGCAFRSALPRADVQRICLFDTWWSNVLVGRTVATIAEVAFVAQWAIILNILGKYSGTSIATKLSRILVPLIVVAEISSWYAVVTTNYMGNAIEESIWALTFSLVTVSIFSLLPKFISHLRTAAIVTFFGVICYVLYMVVVDVPMYLERWNADQAAAKSTLGFWEGLNDLNSRWVVTHEFNEWKPEMIWMGLYFSLAVLSSIALCYAPLTSNRAKKFLTASK
jgi:hypothetical protein